VNELHLFAGVGGGILGGHLLGHTTVCAVEIEPYCRKVLLQRQRDGILPKFPIWDDVTTFDGRPWRGNVDVVAGGFPCTDISQIKQDAEGIDGSASGLWSEMARIIDEVRPRFVFVENSPMLVGRGLGRVVCDLARLGYASKWGVLGARHIGACHARDRLWLLGYPYQQGLQGHDGNGENSKGWQESSGSTSPSGLRISGWKQVVYASDCGGDMDRSNLVCARCTGEYGDCGCPGPTMDDELDYQIRDGIEWARPRNPWTTECGVQRVAKRVPYRVDRLKAIGNAQVGSVAATAWRILRA
jgi:DNA (cytosine-5)-methyltransferase 1